GGHADATLRRIAKSGDGWIMLAHPLGPEADAEFKKLRGYVQAAGRGPAGIGLGMGVSAGAGGPGGRRRQVQGWKNGGVTHITVNNTYARGPHKRIVGRTMEDHLRAMRDYHAAVADLI